MLPKGKKIFLKINNFSYDLMNDAMSLGVHRIWKNEFVNSLGLLKPNKIFKEGKTVEEKLQVIDMAGGTGDISFKIWERAKECSEKYYSKIIKNL